MDRMRKTVVKVGFDVHENLLFFTLFVGIEFSVYHILFLAGDCENNENKCYDGSCYLKSKRCNQYPDCPQGEDELNCPTTGNKYDFFEL